MSSMFQCDGPIGNSLPKRPKSLKKLLEIDTSDGKMLNLILNAVESPRERKRPNELDKGTLQAGAALAGGGVLQPNFRTTGALGASFVTCIRLLVGRCLCR